MSISLVSTIVKHERRVRLVFDNILAAGAFGTSAATLALYSLVNQDGLGPATNITAAFVVASSPAAVELSFGADLAQGALYQIGLASVPCTDASTCSTTSQFRFGAQLQTRANQDVPLDDYASLLYGVDILHNGLDFVETTQGDLATVSGLSCVQLGLRRRCLFAGLTWDPTFGANPRQYVDGVQGAIAGLGPQLERQVLSDDRVKAAAATLYVSNTPVTPSMTSAYLPNDPSIAYYDVAATLIGAETLAPILVGLQAA